MRATRAFVALAGVLLAACQLPTLGQSDAGADGGGGDDAGSSVASDPVGADCTAISPTTTLCAAISTCPSIQLDPTQFPHCGFRMHGAALDLECWCNGQLCPIGVPATCADIPPLVQDQTEDTVCIQVNEGRCTSVGGAGGSSSSGGGSSTCDKACESECGGNPSCIQMCGC